MLVSPLLRYKAIIFVTYMAMYAICYVLPNLFPLSPPNTLPLYAVDLAIPLIPWTFLIYVSDYLLFFLVILIHPTAASFRVFSRQAFLVLFICGTFFLLYPTTYPRPEYPSSSSALITWIMNLIRFADTPNNCFPSMHVAMTGIGAWSLRSVKPRSFPWVFLWTIAIFLSTLTTKQHYVWDVVGGIFVIFSVILIYSIVFERMGLEASASAARK